MFRKLFCNHNYEVLKEIDFKSEFEIIAESNHAPKSYNSLKRTKILVLKCDKCSKIKDKKYHS